MIDQASSAGQMNTIAIREATSNDVDVIYQIFSATDEMHRETYPDIFKQAEFPGEIKAYYLSCINNPFATLFVAEIKNKIVGAIICVLETTAEIPILMPRKFVCIENITVAEDFLQQGIGRALLKAAKAWAARHDASRIELTVWEFNKRATRFYERLGFRTIRRRMVFDL
jgi:ribosomal protein S18 acetylase RimI-like enzyme